MRKLIVLCILFANQNSFADTGTQEKPAKAMENQASQSLTEDIQGLMEALKDIISEDLEIKSSVPSDELLLDGLKLTEAVSAELADKKEYIQTIRFVSRGRPSLDLNGVLTVSCTGTVEALKTLLDSQPD